MLRLKVLIKFVLFFMMTCSGLYSKQTTLSDFLDELSYKVVPAIQDRLNHNYYQPNQVEIDEIIRQLEKHHFDDIVAYGALDVESETASREQKVERFKRLRTILTTLTDEVRPILAENIDEVSKAGKVLGRIDGVLRNKFDYKGKNLCFLGEALSNSCLYANCNALSLIYYSVLKDMFNQPVVIVIRSEHMHIRWKFKNKYINWETTNGKVLSDNFYKEFLGSDYSLEIGNYDEVLATTYYNRGHDKEALGNAKGALQDYNTAIELNPKEAYAYNNRGCVKDKLRDIKGALQDYNTAIELNPKEAYAYNNRGYIKDKLGDIKGALQDYNTAIELNHKYVTAYYNRGLAKKKLGDKQGALKDFHMVETLGNQNVYGEIEELKGK